MEEDETLEDPASEDVKSTSAKLVTSCKKLPLLRAMEREHPTVTLDVGTLAVNARRAQENKFEAANESTDTANTPGVALNNANTPDVAGEVVKVLKTVVRLAAATKRECQQLIGRFVEHIANVGASNEDRELLDLICGRITEDEKKKFAMNTQDKNDTVEECNETEGKEGTGVLFLRSLLTYLYSGNFPIEKGTGIQVNKFIRRMENLGFLKREKNRGALNTRSTYPGSSILRSAASQMAAELTRHYRTGTLELHEMVMAGSGGKVTLTRYGTTYSTLTSAIALLTSP